MGPTNIALVLLSQADQALRAAQARLDSASRSVRVQERRINDLSEQLTLAQTQLRERQSGVAQLELDIKSRDAKIERFREQQQNSKNHKEYQAFLTEIATEKIDKAKIEEEAMKAMEVVEQNQKEIAELVTQLETERKNHAENSKKLAGKLAELKADVDELKPKRDEAAAKVPAKAIDMFERLADRYEGEAMSPMSKPVRRREEYICAVCNMSLVPDIYNRLHARDELVFCPNCHRLLYIPDDLPPETAVHKPKERKVKIEKGGPASITRQVDAAAVSGSITPEAEPEEPREPEAAPEQPAASTDEP